MSIIASLDLMNVLYTAEYVEELPNESWFLIPAVMFLVFSQIATRQIATRRKARGKEHSMWQSIRKTSENCLLIKIISRALM